MIFTDTFILEEECNSKKINILENVNVSHFLKTTVKTHNGNILLNNIRLNNLDDNTHTIYNNINKDFNNSNYDESFDEMDIELNESVCIELDHTQHLNDKINTHTFNFERKKTMEAINVKGFLGVQEINHFRKCSDINVYKNINK
jgi:hypothetical protein